jgi:hypothetical protein
MCCGQKRSNLQQSPLSSTRQNVPRVISGNSRSQALRTQTSAPPPVASTLPAGSAGSLSASVRPQAAATPASQVVGLRYVENSPIRVRGLVSGVSYEFSGTRAVQEVDVRDASSLLNTRFFRRA